MILLIARDSRLENKDYPQLLDIYDNWMIEELLNVCEEMNDYYKEKQEITYHVIKNVKAIHYQTSDELSYITYESNDEYILKPCDYSERILDLNFKNQKVGA